MAANSKSNYFRRILKETRKTYRISGLTRFTFGHKSQICLDLGSNVGTFSIVYSKYFYKILGFDASAKCVRDAQINIAKAGIRNVEVIHTALAAESFELVELRRVYVGDFYESKDFTTLNWDVEEMSKSDFSGRIGEIEEVVRSTAWPDLITQAGYQFFNFVKCDIEGAEYDLFMHQDLTSIGFLCMELHYTALGPRRTRALVKHLSTQLDFYYPEQTHSFLNEWPPPEILRMVNPSFKHPLYKLDRFIVLVQTRLIASKKRLRQPLRW